MYIDLQNAADEVGHAELYEAFGSTIFVYGTQSGFSVLGQSIKKIIGRANENRTVGKEKWPDTIFEPGRRVYAYLELTREPHLKQAQMMDMYFGQPGTLHELRNETITRWIFKCMKFDGVPEAPGWKLYEDTYGLVRADGKPVKGWERPPENAVHPRLDAVTRWNNDGCFFPNPDKGGRPGLSATKYMSYIIREGIKEFGGALVFEGANVFYKDVFISKPDEDPQDTVLEARALLPYFSNNPGKSTVSIGNGSLTFHWFGQPAVPTQSKFSENWVYIKGSRHQPGNYRGPGQVASPLFNAFPAQHVSDVLLRRHRAVRMSLMDSYRNAKQRVAVAAEEEEKNGA